MYLSDYVLQVLMRVFKFKMYNLLTRRWGDNVKWRLNSDKTYIAKEVLILCRYNILGQYMYMCQLRIVLNIYSPVHRCDNNAASAVYPLRVSHCVGLPFT